MSTHQIKSTGWIARNYNGRGLITHNFANRNLVRTSQGVLWAVIRENIQSKYFRLYRSTTNGFSWDLMWNGTFTQPGFRSQSIAGLNTNGPITQLMIDERRNRMLLLVSMYNAATAKYQIEPFLFKITSDDFAERITTVGEDAPAILTLIANDMDELAFAASQNDDFIWITFASISKLKLMLCRIDEPIVTENMPDATGNSYFNIHDSVADDNDYLHVSILEDRGANYAMVYTRFSRVANSWSTPVIMSEFPANDVFDVNLVRSLDGRLTCLYAQMLDGGNQVTVRYTFSTDNGATWSTPEDITTAASADFRDAATTQLAARVNAIASLEGDVFVSYTGKAVDVDTTYWKKLEWDGTTYVQQTEHVLESYSSGAKFFRPTSTNLLSAEDPNNIRVGFTIGQGNSTNQLDTVPVKVRQKSLLEGTEVDEDNYDEGEPALNQLEVDFNILGAPNDNIDFYAAGVTGFTTNKYIGAFKRIGTSMRLIRFEPDANSYLSDRSAYYKYDEYSTQVLFDSLNYDFPTQGGMDDFETYIERDTRKLYLPPDFHLGRTFLLNNGEYLKRTVWIGLYDGNEYELSQVLPFFYNNQIAYYTANAYVVGPSNDPFAKNVLTTET